MDNYNYSYNYPYVPVSNAMDQNYSNISTSYANNMFYSTLTASESAVNTSMFNSVLYPNSLYTVPHSSANLHSFAQPFLPPLPQSAPKRKRRMAEYENEQHSDNAGEDSKRYNLRPRQSSSSSSSTNCSTRKLDRHGLVNKELQAGGTVSSTVESDPTRNIFNVLNSDSMNMQSSHHYSLYNEIAKKNMKHQLIYDPPSDALDLTSSSQCMLAARSVSSQALSSHSMNEPNINVQAEVKRTDEEISIGQTMLMLRSRPNAYELPPYDYSSSVNFVGYNESSVFGRQCEFSNRLQSPTDCPQYMNIDTGIKETGYPTTTGSFEMLQTEVDLSNIAVNPFNTLPSTVPMLQDINFTHSYGQPMFPYSPSNQLSLRKSSLESYNSPSRVTRSFAKTRTPLCETTTKAAASQNYTAETTKRSRTTFNSNQSDLLELEFSSNNYCDKNVRERLSELLGVTEKQIKIWFQNRRMRDRKKNPKAYANASGCRGRRRRKADEAVPTINNVYGTTEFSRAMEAPAAPNVYVSKEFYKAGDALALYSSSLERSSSASQRSVEGVQVPVSLGCPHGARLGDCVMCKPKEAVANAKLVQKTAGAANSSCTSSPEYLGEYGVHTPSSPCNLMSNDPHRKAVTTHQHNNIIKETLNMAKDLNSLEKNKSTTCLSVQPSDSMYPKPCELIPKNQTCTSNRKNCENQVKKQSEDFSDISSDNQDTQTLEAQNCVSISKINSQIRQPQEVSSLNVSPVCKARIYQSSLKNNNNGQKTSLFSSILNENNQTVESGVKNLNTDEDFLNVSSKGDGLSRQKSSRNFDAQKESRQNSGRYSEVPKDEVSENTSLCNLGKQISDVPSSNMAHSKGTYNQEKNSPLPTYDVYSNSVELQAPYKPDNMLEKLDSACSTILKSIETNISYHQTKQSHNVVTKILIQNSTTKTNECKSINNQDVSFDINFEQALHNASGKSANTHQNQQSDCESIDSLHSLIIDETFVDKPISEGNGNTGSNYTYNNSSSKTSINTKFTSTNILQNTFANGNIDTDFDSMPKLSPAVDYSKSGDHFKDNLSYSSSSSPADFPICPRINVLESYEDRQRSSSGSNAPIEYQYDSIEMPFLSQATNCPASEETPNCPTYCHEKKLIEKISPTLPFKHFLKHPVANSVSGNVQSIYACSNNTIDFINHEKFCNDAPEVTENDICLSLEKFLCDNKSISEIENKMSSISENNRMLNAYNSETINNNFNESSASFNSKCDPIYTVLDNDSKYSNLQNVNMQIKSEHGNVEENASNDWYHHVVFNHGAPQSSQTAGCLDGKVKIKTEPVDDYYDLNTYQQSSVDNSGNDLNHSNQTCNDDIFSGSAKITDSFHNTVNKKNEMSGKASFSMFHTTNTPAGTSDIFINNFPHGKTKSSSNNLLTENKNPDIVPLLNRFINNSQSTWNCSDRNSFLTSPTSRASSISGSIRRSSRIKKLQQNETAVQSSQLFSAKDKSKSTTQSSEVADSVSDLNPHKNSPISSSEIEDKKPNKATAADYSCTQNGLKLSIKKKTTPEDYSNSTQEVLIPENEIKKERED